MIADPAPCSCCIIVSGPIPLCISLDRLALYAVHAVHVHAVVITHDRHISADRLLPRAIASIASRCDILDGAHA
jgi:hypothetical protein